MRDFGVNSDSPPVPETFASVRIFWEMHIHCICKNRATMSKHKSDDKKKKKKSSQLVLRIDAGERDAFVKLCDSLDTSAAREIRRFMREWVAEHAPKADVGQVSEAAKEPTEARRTPLRLRSRTGPQKQSQRPEAGGSPRLKRRPDRQTARQDQGSGGASPTRRESSTKVERVCRPVAAASARQQRRMHPDDFPPDPWRGALPCQP